MSVGHSLGGALAQIVTLMIKIASETDHKELTVPVRCVTFASPMPFARFPDESQHNVQKTNQVRLLEWFRAHTVNFINNNDVIPRLPRYASFVNKFHNISSMIHNFFESDTIRAMGELFNNESIDVFIGFDSEKKWHNHTTKHTQDPIMPPTPDFLSELFPDDVNSVQLCCALVVSIVLYYVGYSPEGARKWFNDNVTWLDGSLRSQLGENRGLLRHAAIHNIAHSVNIAMGLLPYQPAQRYLYFMLCVRVCVWVLDGYFVVRVIVHMVAAMLSLLFGFAWNWKLMERHGYEVHPGMFYDGDVIEMIKNPIKGGWWKHDSWYLSTVYSHYIVVQGKVVRDEEGEVFMQLEREEELNKWQDNKRNNTAVLADKTKDIPIFKELKEDGKKGKLIMMRPTRLRSWVSRLNRIDHSWVKRDDAFQDHIRDVTLMVIVLIFVELCFAALSIMGVGLIIGRKIAGLFIRTMTDSLVALSLHHCIDKYVIYVSKQYNMSHNLDDTECCNMAILT